MALATATRSRRSARTARRRSAAGPPRAAAGPAARFGDRAGRSPGPVAARLPGRAVLDPPGRRHRPGPGRPLGGRRHRHRLGQVALLPGADRRGRRPQPVRPSHLAADLPHQGAGPGPAARAHRRSSVPRLVAATYDGDTGPEERTWVRANANVVLTNPEMLHHGILPHHDRWATFLMRLALRRGRRAARAAGRVRHPRRPPAAPPAAAVRGTTARRPDLHLLVGHHRRRRVGWPPSCAGSTWPR